MRTSCNGCRVLRKGCNEECVIRPSIEWIKSPDSQANATVFLAKFYGRAGLLNLLSTAAPNLRPAIFKSLLYEACGRIVDPVYGSAGLMWSGQWHHCQAAVDAVLRGLPIIQLPDPTPGEGAIPPPPLSPVVTLELCDVRHLSSKGNDSVQGSRTRSKMNFRRPDRHSEADQDESMFSNETVEPTVACQVDPNGYEGMEDPGPELTLGPSQYRSSWL